MCNTGGYLLAARTSNSWNTARQCALGHRMRLSNSESWTYEHQCITSTRFISSGRNHRPNRRDRDGITYTSQRQKMPPFTSMNSQTPYYLGLNLMLTLETPLPLSSRAATCNTSTCLLNQIWFKRSEVRNYIALEFEESCSWTLRDSAGPREFTYYRKIHCKANSEWKWSLERKSPKSKLSHDMITISSLEDREARHGEESRQWIETPGGGPVPGSPKQIVVVIYDIKNISIPFCSVQQFFGCLSMSFTEIHVAHVEVSTWRGPFRLPWAQRQPKLPSQRTPRHATG